MDLVHSSVSHPATRVRGIYATALTRLLLSHNVPIAEPSAVIATRLGLAATAAPTQVQISDRHDRQGVVLAGEEDALATILELLRAELPRSVTRPERDGHACWNLELPASEKARLDELRCDVMPTLSGHHHLKIIHSAAVDAAELELARTGTDRASLSRDVWQRLAGNQVRKDERIAVQHVKPAGQVYDLGGQVSSFDGRHLRIRRRFTPGGMYDSLNVPRLAGDYGRLDIELGSGISVRRYYRATGEHLGDLYNLATAAELYPGIVRYVDLELDVLHMPGNRPLIVDQADLERAHQRGYLSDTLVDDAWRLARRLVESLVPSA